MCAEQFLTDGDISVDIGIAAAPVITANYIESYHKVNDDFRYIVEQQCWISFKWCNVQ